MVHQNTREYGTMLFSVFITKTYLYNFDPLKPHFYIVHKTGVYRGIHYFSAPKHRLWVLVRTASLTGDGCVCLCVCGGGGGGWGGGGGGGRRCRIYPIPNIQTSQLFTIIILKFERRLGFNESIIE